MKFNLIIAFLVLLSACSTSMVEKRVDSDLKEQEENLLLELRTNIQGYGKDSLSILDALRNLKVFYQSQGQYLKSEPILLDELTLLRKHYSDDHPIVEKSWNEVVELFKITRTVEEAEALKKALIRLSKK